MSEEQTKIQTAAAEAVKVIATAAGEATKVVANAAAESSKLLTQMSSKNSADHDLIIKLDTKMDALKEDIRMLNDGTATKIGDHETRMRRLELWGFMSIGFLYAVQFYLTFIRK